MGCDARRKKNGFWATSFKTSIHKEIAKVEQAMGDAPVANTPLIVNDHPEEDNSTPLNDLGLHHYQMTIGCLNSIVTLGRMDIGCATISSSRFSARPREGHLAIVLRIVGCLKKRPNLEIVCDRTDTHQTNGSRTANRKELMLLYPDSVEEVDSGLPILKHKASPLSTCYEDDLAHDRVTKRSIGGVLGMAGKTIIVHKSKMYASVETPTYGAELNAGRVGIENVQEMRRMLRSLGVEVDRPKNIMVKISQCVNLVPMRTPNVKAGIPVCPTIK